MNNHLDRLLRIREVAEVLAVSVRTVYRLVQEGMLAKPVKVRGCSCWPSSEVEACLVRIKQGI